MAKVTLTSKFAHLMSLATGKPAAAVPAAAAPAAAAAAESDDEEDPERKKKDGETDDDYAKRMKALDDKEKEEAEAEDDEEKAAALRAEGAAAENARWTEVMAHAECGGRVALACTLLSDTDLAAPAVIASLATAPRETRASTLASRQRAEPVVPVPAPTGGADAGAAAAGTDAAWAADLMKVAEANRPTKRPA